MKVVVYAICKNERAFADRWMASMSEADEVYVLDTGSTDGTPQRLEELGAHVTVETITPWRFDVARNRSLDLVPADADLCVCTDLDEVFQPGWREKVEEAWTPGVDRLLYRYTWNFLPDGREGMVYWYDKMHRRWGCRWVNPVHEGRAPNPLCGGGAPGTPPGSEQEPQPVPPLAGTGGGGKPGERPQRPLPGAGVLLLPPVGGEHRHAQTPPGPALRHLGR